MFHGVFHTDGLPLVGPIAPTACPMGSNGGKGGPDGLPNGSKGETKKAPTAGGTVRASRRAVSVGWVIYGFTPAGLQSHCTVRKQFRQVPCGIYFFPIKTNNLGVYSGASCRVFTQNLTKTKTNPHNGLVPVASWQGETPFYSPCEQKSRDQSHLRYPSFPSTFTNGEP